MPFTKENPGRPATILKMTQLPNFPMKLRDLLRIGGASPHIACSLVYRGKVVTTKNESGNNMVSVEEIQRLRDIGFIKINE